MCPFFLSNKRHEGGFYDCFHSETVATTNAFSGGTKQKKFSNHKSKESFVSFKDRPFMLVPKEDIAQKETKKPTKTILKPMKQDYKTPVHDHSFYRKHFVKPTLDSQFHHKHFEKPFALSEGIKLSHVKESGTRLRFTQEEHNVEHSKMIIKKFTYIDDSNIPFVITHNFCSPLEGSSIDALIPVGNNILVIKGRPVLSVSDRTNRISLELSNFLDFALKKIEESSYRALYDSNHLNIKCFDFVVGSTEKVFKHEKENNIFKLRVILNERNFNKARVKHAIFDVLNNKVLNSEHFQDGGFAIIHFTEMRNYSERNIAVF